MTGIFAAMDASNAHAMGSPEEMIETRFGPVAIHRHHPIHFASGVLGMPDKQLYCLADFPSERMRRFKLLQSLDDLKLSFITLPLELNNSILNSDDVATAAKELGIALTNLGLLAIVSVHRMADGVRLSINARAPVFIDTAKRAAVQHVFGSDKYLVQHFITV